MMKRTLVAAVAALLVLSSCGSDDAKEPEKTTSSPSADPSETAEPTTAAPTEPAPAPAKLVIEPGRVGPAKAGMSKADALKTGLFNADVPPPVEGCPPYPLQWKKKYKGLDVLTRDDGSISSIGVTKGGPKTSKGIGYGSTLDDLTKAYPNLSPVVDAGFNQAGAYEFTDDEFIGFLFGDATVSDIKGSSKISFIEVTVGDKPDLIRSGC
jgi:hypothetical protein